MCKRQDLKNKKYIKDLKPGDFFKFIDPFFHSKEDKVISISEWIVDPDRVFLKTVRFKSGLLYRKNIEIVICAKNKD